MAHAHPGTVTQYHVFTTPRVSIQPAVPLCLHSLFFRVAMLANAAIKQILLLRFAAVIPIAIDQIFFRVALLRVRFDIETDVSSGCVSSADGCFFKFLSAIHFFAISFPLHISVGSSGIFNRSFGVRSGNSSFLSFDITASRSSANASGDVRKNWSIRLTSNSE